jgi:hypothetical protein
MQATVATTCHLTVYATGQRRVSRAAHDFKIGDDVLTDALRERLPPGIADEVEAFRRRAALSPETLLELERHWEGADGEGGPRRRAEEVSACLSMRSRGEVERFQRELRRLSPGVLAHLRQGIAAQAHAELMRPAWGGELGEEDDG